MSDFAYFVVETVLVSIVSTGLCVCSARQIIYDYAHNEPWRSLIASHHLTAASIILQCITNFDPAAGLGLYTYASISFLNDTIAFLEIAAGSALAASFLDGYRKMVMTSKGPPYTAICLSVMHTLFFLLGFLIFSYGAISRNAWAAVVARVITGIYSVAVCAQIFYSAGKIRNLLHKEFKRSGKYGNAVRKLNRVIIVLAILLIIGNIANWIVMQNNIDEALVSPTLRIPEPVFNPQHLLTDFTSLVTPSLLLVGGWRVSDFAGKSTKSTTPVRDLSDHVNSGDVELAVKGGSRSPAPVPDPV